MLTDSQRRAAKVAALQDHLPPFSDCFTRRRPPDAAPEEDPVEALSAAQIEALRVSMLDTLAALNANPVASILCRGEPLLPAERWLPLPEPSPEEKAREEERQRAWDLDGRLHTTCCFPPRGILPGLRLDEGIARASTSARNAMGRALQAVHSAPFGTLSGEFNRRD